MTHKKINMNIYVPDKKKAYCKFLLCDATDSCELYKQGKCAHDDFLWNKRRCPHQKIICEYGYTERAAKYNSWKRAMAYNHKDIHNILQIGYEKMAIVGGDYVFLPYPYLKNYRNSLSGVVNEYFVPLEDFDIEFIEKIYSFKPIALMGGEIMAFQDKYMPLFFRHLKEVLPELFDAFMEKHPQILEVLSEKLKDHRGRKAYIYTLKQGGILKDCHNAKWEIVGDELVCRENRSSLIPWASDSKRPTTVKVKIQNDMTYKIDNNDIVTENTVFVD